MKNWLEIGIGLYLLGMILYGHYRGFIRMAVSIAALTAAFIIVYVAMPSVAAFIKSQTPIYGWIQEGLENTIIPKESPSGIFNELSVIENMNLPKELQELLIENNNRSVYAALGVNAFTEYISNYLTGLIINTTGFFVLFILVYVAVSLLMRWLDLVAKLPVLSGLNKIAGALLGGLQGLIFLWLLSMLVTAFSGSNWARAIISQIESSKWLTFLYHNNMMLGSKAILTPMIHGLLRISCSRNPKNIQNPPCRATFSCFCGSQSHVLTCKHVIHDLLTLIS